MSTPASKQPGRASEGSLEFRPALIFLNHQRDFLPHRASWINSILVHLLVLTALVIPHFLNGVLRPQSLTPLIDVSKVIPIYWPGGGGGDRSRTPASRGALPPFSRTQLAPPSVHLLVPNPRIPVQANILGPPQLKLPEMVTHAVFGDPHGADGPASNGPGKNGGIGDGEDGGIGPHRGPGHGLDGEIFDPGQGGVSAPWPIYKPEPPYSEEARKAKHQGTVTLIIVVSAEGNVTDARVVRPLGMGLDEKALETVLLWQFRPGTRNGVPVAVRAFVEVSFRLF